jgi:hypothetical protein
MRLQVMVVGYVSFQCTCCVPTNTHLDYALVYYSTVCFKLSVWNSYQKKLEMDCDIQRWMRNYCLSVKHTQPSKFHIVKNNHSIIIHISLYYLCSTGKARNVRDAVIYFVFPRFVAHWHSYLKVSCLNLTVDKQFYLQKRHTLQAFLSLKVYLLLIKNMN